MGTHQSDDDNAKVQEEAARCRTHYYDAAKVTIMRGDPLEDFWLAGTINGRDGYTFEAKVYGVGSEHGIDGGRISKLAIHENGRPVVSYDRSWEAGPNVWTLDTRAAVEDVKAAFAKNVPADIEKQYPTVFERYNEKSEQKPAEQDERRPVNPMGFFKKPEQEATASRKDWSRTRVPARHTSAPIADHTDDNDHSR